MQGELSSERTVGSGTVYRIAPDNSVTILHSFTGGRADGTAPPSGAEKRRKASCTPKACPINATPCYPVS